MRLYISVDMEGIPGTFNWEHEKLDRVSVRNYIQDHLVTAIEAILESEESKQLTEITIADAHSHGDNLYYELTDLDPRISLISGDPRPAYMMPAFDSGYTMVFLLGYHAATGTLHGNMDHTYSNSRIQRIWLNGTLMSEALINAAFAGYHKVPVTLVSGDLALMKQLEQDMPWLEYVCTKEGVSKFAAKNYSRALVRKQLQDAIPKALAKIEAPIYTINPPVNLQIEFHSTSMADMACLMPEVKRIDGKTVTFTHEDYAVMFDAIMALITLAASTNI
jgi:D-amino peptidase